MIYPVSKALFGYADTIFAGAQPHGNSGSTKAYFLVHMELGAAEHQTISVTLCGRVDWKSMDMRGRIV